MSDLAGIGKRKHAHLTAEAVLCVQEMDLLIAQLLDEVRNQERQPGRPTFGTIYRLIVELMQQHHRQEIALLNMQLLIEQAKDGR
jgi:hypothetical protein